MAKTKKIIENVEEAVEAKPAVKKTVKKVEDAAAGIKSTDVKKETGKIIAEVVDLEGKAAGRLTLADEIFGVKFNKDLISQAVRVFRANQRLGTASTKTRGEVKGSSRKIYRQKGTGRARHGSIRAPIFVHGGIVGGPKPRDYSLEMPKKMKRLAVFGVLSEKFRNGEIKIVSGFEAMEPKTKNFAGVIGKLGLENKKKKILVVTAEGAKNLIRAARNVEGVALTGAKRINVYDVLVNKNLLFMKEAIVELEKHFLKKEDNKA